MIENQNIYYSLVISTTLAFITNFISFVSPYWIQSIPSANSQFQRIGLWTACFNGYMRPGMYNKAYFGCYYIYYIEYDAVRDWINPVWFYGIQVSSSCGILVQFLVFFFVMCQLTRSISRINMSILKFNLIGHFFTCITLTAALVAFAVARYDSRWMPYPGLNVLSWSYALAALSFVLSLTAFLLAFVYYIHLDAQLDTEHKLLIDNEENPDISSPIPITDGNQDELEAFHNKSMGKQSHLGSSLVRPEEWDDKEPEFPTDIHQPSATFHDPRR